MTPLAGIRVVEAAAFISGPFAAMILSDLGADVVKVEPPRGETYRRMGRVHGGSSLLYRGVNQNKSGVVLDLKDDRGLQRLHALLADADVFLTNWRPGVAESFGLTETAVRTRYPSLIWVRVSGYGQTGPKATSPAYDAVILAESGAMRSGMGPGDPPADTNSNVTDKVTAMMAAQTATAALRPTCHHGQRHGVRCRHARRQRRTSTAPTSAPDIARPDLPVDPGPAETSVRRTTFSTADGWLTIVPVTKRQLLGVLEAVGHIDAWESIKRNGADGIWPAMVALLEPILGSASARQWQRRFADADVPCTVVKDFGDHLQDEQVVHNRIYVPVGDDGTGSFLQVRYPGLFDGAPVDIDHRPAPGLEPHRH